MTTTIAQTVAGNGLIINMPTGAENMASGLRISGYSPSIELMDNTSSQNWYIAIDDNVSNRFEVGAGYGPGQGLVPIITIHPVTKVVTIGDGNISNGGLLSVTSDDAQGQNDWIAWFIRDGTAGGGSEALIRFQHFCNTGATPQPIMSGLSARGTRAAPSAILSNDHLFILDGRGFDGSSINHGEYAAGWSDTRVQIAFRAGGNWNGTRHPSYMTFTTTPVGAITPLERLRINAAGDLEIREIAAPSAGEPNTCKIYAEDNGSGKTRLMALFSSGVPQQLALQP